MRIKINQFKFFMLKYRLIKSSYLLLGCLLVVACKKEYTCKCTTTVSYTGHNDIYSSKTTKFSEKMKKEEAQAICNHEGTNINTSYYNAFTEGGTFPINTSFKTSCTLQ